MALIWVLEYNVLVKDVFCTPSCVCDICVCFCTHECDIVPVFCWVWIIQICRRCQAFSAKILLFSSLFNSSVPIFLPHQPCLCSLTYVSICTHTHTCELTQASLPVLFLCWGNWAHKRWKGLFKRNCSVMKPHYCIPWCNACGSSCSSLLNPVCAD